MGKNKKGVWVLIRWKDEPITETQEVFIAFSHDQHDDDGAFFYCNGEHELKNLMQFENGEDFVVMEVL